MNIITPTPLHKGDTIGFIAPSSPLNIERLEPGMRFFESQGFKVKLSTNLRAADRFLAGTDQERADDLMTFFKDSKVKAIVATAGGYGSQRLLPYLDYDVIRANPKILTGFSDTTALQLALLAKASLVSYTGFTLRDTDPGKPDPLVAQTFNACLSGERYEINEGVSVNPGIATGTLVGGNLALICALMSTPYQPNFKDTILLFEDVWAEPFLVDSRLSQLELAGVFNEVAGIIIGQFEHCQALHSPERDGTIDEVINEWSTRFKVPCIKNFPYGHGDRRCVLPIGKTVLLNADKVVTKLI